jgi:hypothetical protein
LFLDPLRNRKEIFLSLLRNRRLFCYVIVIEKKSERRRRRRGRRK